MMLNGITVPHGNNIATLEHFSALQLEMKTVLDCVGVFGENATRRREKMKVLNVLGLKPQRCMSESCVPRDLSCCKFNSH